jgi:hypothetical protein
MSSATFTDPGTTGDDWEAKLLTDIGDDLEPAELVLLDVDVELERQDALWGDQSHLPNGTTRSLVGVADQLRENADRNAKDGTLTFADILFEEVYEAMAEEDEEKLEIELIQVAAVAAQWVKAIRARRARGQVE